MSLIPYLLLGYLLGSMPTRALLTEASGANALLVDLGTLVLDITKGAAALLTARHLSPDAALWAGFAAVIGDLFPMGPDLPPGLKRGNGAATALGVLLAVSPPIAFAACGLGLFTAAILRQPAVGTLYGFLAALFAALLTDGGQYVPLTFGVTIAVYWGYRRAIGRILAGTEPKLTAAEILAYAEKISKFRDFRKSVEAPPQSQREYRPGNLAPLDGALRPRRKGARGPA